MTPTPSRVTIHMAASLDGFIARTDGRVDWMHTSDSYPEGEVLTPEAIEGYLNSIDAYVMGSRTYERALGFEAEGHGWPYGDKPVFVLTSRTLPRNRESVEFRSGDLAEILRNDLGSRFPSLWVAGGAELCSACLRQGLVDEICYTILPMLLGDGVPFFGSLPADLPLHLLDCKAYTTGMVELRYAVANQGAG